MNADTTHFLVSTEWLAGHLNDPELRVFDCTSRLVPDTPTSYRVETARYEWAREHIPGAGYIDLEADCSDLHSPLRFMLAPPPQLAQALGRLGIAQDSRVVLYSTSEANWATRMWWVLRCAGFDNAAVLDGGFAKWKAEGRPVSDAPCRYLPATFVPQPRPQLMCERDAVLAAIGDAGTVIVNGLARDRHAGTGGMHYGRPGRIAGSVNVPGRELVDPRTGVFLPRDELQRRFAAVGVAPDRAVITYCGGGIAAATVAFALALLGHEHICLYDGSLQEWAADPQLPMECD